MTLREVSDEQLQRMFNLHWEWCRLMAQVSDPLGPEPFVVNSPVPRHNLVWAEMDRRYYKRKYG